MSEKAVCQRTLRKTTRRMGWNTIAICATGPLQYLAITVKVVAMEKVSFSDKQIPKVFYLDIDSWWEALSPY